MKNKNILIILITLAVAAGIYWSINGNPITTQNQENTSDNGRIASSTGIDDGREPQEIVAAEMFTGKLEEVNTGCFADGECFVVVDGIHITTTIGWSQATVGSIQGVSSFGDLADHIGEQVEVYARGNLDGTYTLYGREEYYVKLK